MSEGRVRLIRYIVGILVCAALGAAIVGVYLKGHWYSIAETQAERYRLLCDGFTVAGVILVAASGLVLVYNMGLFTGLTYGLRGLKDIFLPFLQNEYVPYREYKKQKAEKKVKNYSFIFFTGLAFLAIAIYFYVRFYGVYVPQYSQDDPVSLLYAALTGSGMA